MDPSEYRNRVVEILKSIDSKQEQILFGLSAILSEIKLDKTQENKVNLIDVKSEKIEEGDLKNESDSGGIPH